MDQVFIPWEIYLSAGVGLDATTMWLLMRRSAEIGASQATSEAQIEIARLNEKLASGSSENEELRRRLELANASADELRQQVEGLIDERARLVERATRPGT